MKKIIFILSIIFVFSASVFANIQFMRAIMNGDINTVEEYIHSGIDVNARSNDNYGSTPLMTAILSGGHTEIVKLLLLAGAGASINTQDYMYGWTALHLASMSGYTEIVRILVYAGAEIHIQSKNGSTALSSAYNAEIANILRSAGATY